MKILAGLIVLCSSVGVAMGADALPNDSVDRLIPIDVRDITVEGEIGRRINLTIDKNLLALDIEKDFIKPFQEKRTEGTWEYTALGKLVDATVRFAAYSNDERVLALRKHLTDAVKGCQEADGYVGMFTPGNRLANLWDIHEMSYLILGMLTDYQYFGDEKSLECAETMMDYMIANWKSAHPWTQAKVGLDYTVLQLYKETGEKDYLDFCLNERKLADWDKPIKLLAPSTADEDGDGIDGHHSYAYMDECRSQLELHRISPNEKLLERSRKVVEFLTRENGLFITGSCSCSEDWTIDQDGKGNCEESCATAYLLRLLESKLRLEGESLYGDMMERAIYNALFAAQAADGRKLRYFTPFEGPRQYFHIDTSCCPGNFRRIMAELPSMVYWKSGTGVTINLYTESNAKLKLANVYTPGSAPVKIADGATVEISQKTDYPNSGKVIVEVKPSESAKFPLSLRIPRWCKKATVSVNGTPLGEEVNSGTFFTIERKWESGDKIELNMPMEVRLVKGRVANVMKVAVMRGPVLFCLNPSLNEQFAAIDADGLIGLKLDAFEGPVNDRTVRSDGMGIKVSMWAKNKQGQVTAVDLLLTEFPDPNGQITYLPMQGLYFQGESYGDKNVKNIDMMVEDELYMP